MNDKQKPSNSPDESEHQDLPVDADQDTGKGKRKSRRNRKINRLSSNKDQDPKEQIVPQIEEKDSAADDDDDLLAGIRRSLIEEEVSKREKKQKGIIQRVTRLIKPGKVSSKEEPKTDELKREEIDTAPVVEDVQKTIEDTAVLSSGDENALVAETDKTSDTDAESENVESIPVEQDVIALILGLEPGELIPEHSQDELLLQPELEETNITEKTRGSEVLRTQLEKEKIDERFESIREVALEDYGDSSVQPEALTVVSLRQRFRIFLKELRPLDRALIFGAASLILIAGMIGFGFQIISAQLPQATPAPTQELPFPVRVALPGGWEFKLTKGKVENDKWSPKGPEWLEGTELCKWIALPWSLQLEAVVRTLKSNDPIELTMSNADQLKFKVQSINNVPVDQIDTLNTTKTCLLLILVNEDVDTRWVVTAIP